MYPQNRTVYFYDCNEIVFLRKRLNGMEILSHPRLVFIMDMYSEVEQSDLTGNKKSGSTHIWSREVRRVLGHNLSFERQYITQTQTQNSGRSCETEDSTEVPWQIRSLEFTLAYKHKPTDTSRKKLMSSILYGQIL